MAPRKNSTRFLMLFARQASPALAHANAHSGDCDDIRGYRCRVTRHGLLGKSNDERKAQSRGPPTRQLSFRLVTHET